MTKERKAFLVNIGLFDNTTKKKFISEVDKKWTEFAQKNNDWVAFVQSLKEYKIVFG